MHRIMISLHRRTRTLTFTHTLCAIPRHYASLSPLPHSLITTTLLDTSCDPDVISTARDPDEIITLSYYYVHLVSLVVGQHTS